MKKISLLIIIVLSVVMLGACSDVRSGHYYPNTGGEALDLNEIFGGSGQIGQEETQQATSAPISGEAKAEVESIVFAEGVTELEVGQSIKLYVSVMPAEAAGSQLIWSSQNPSVVMVDNYGYITGVSSGVALVTCTALNGKSASCAINVSESDGEYYGTDVPAEEEISSDDNDYDDSDDFVFYDSSSRLLTASEVKWLSKKKVQRAINEIYARHGYVFQTKSIRKYFKSKSWYVEDPSFKTKDFSKIERKNLDLLQKYR